MDFINLLFKLALPIIFQNFLNSSMALMDTLMIGQLNETAIAAVGIANQFVFIFIVVQFGTHSGMSIFTAQYWGKKELTNIKKLMGIGLMAGFTVSSGFILLALVTPETLIRLYSKDTEVIRLGAGYLRIVGVSFAISVVSYAYRYSLRSMGLVKLPMYAGMIAVILNLVLNYILIFGKFGFPALGVNGAAIATCISRFAEGFTLVGIVYYKKYPIAAGISEMLDFDYPFFKKIFKTCWPVFLNELFWAIGISLYNLVYARVGIESIAAVNIVASIENFMLIPFYGMFHAGAIIIGNTIGSGNDDKAYLYGKHLLILQFVMAIFAGALMILSSDMVLSFYKISEEAYLNAHHLMFVAGAVLCFKITNFTTVVSVLRGGGDTRFGFLMDVTGIWCIGVPLAFFGAFFLHLPVYWVMALVVTEEIYKLCIGIFRFLSRKWIKNLVTA